MTTLEKLLAKCDLDLAIEDSINQAADRWINKERWDRTEGGLSDTKDSYAGYLACKAISRIAKFHVNEVQIDVSCYTDMLRSAFERYVKIENR